jgi:hypothetical protein
VLLVLGGCDLMTSCIDSTWGSSCSACPAGYQGDPFTGCSDINEVRIFVSRTRKLLQVLENPEAQIDRPHGVLFTEKYLLISNAYDFSKPGTINVYRNDSTIKKPIQIFQTPFSHLREPHSLALRDGRLVATYAENHPVPSGAIVSYAFNEETGNITGPLDKTESWFRSTVIRKGFVSTQMAPKYL